MLLTVVILANFMLTLGLFLLEPLLKNFDVNSIYFFWWLNHRYGYDAYIFYVIYPLVGVIEAFITFVFVRFFGASWKLYFYSAAASCLGCAMFWWFNPDLTSARYGGGDFFTLEVLLKFGFLLFGFLSFTFLHCLQPGIPRCLSFLKMINFRIWEK